MYSTPKAVELIDQLAETEEPHWTHNKEHETKVVWLNYLASQRILLQQKTADTLAHALGPVVSLPASLKIALKETGMVSEQRDEYHMKCEQADGAHEDWSTSAEKAAPQKRGLMARSDEKTLQLKKGHVERRAVGKGLSISLKAQETDLTSPGPMNDGFHGITVLFMQYYTAYLSATGGRIQSISSGSFLKGQLRRRNELFLKCFQCA